MKKIMSAILGFLLLAVPVLAQSEQTFEFLQNLGFTQILIWLLTFAIVQGILSQIQVPKSRASQTIISIAVAFLVLLSPVSGLLGPVLARLSSGLLLLILGILVLLVFLEVTGLKFRHMVETRDKETGKVTGRGIVESKLFEAHPRLFAIILIVFAVLLFVGAGGLGLLGFSVNLPSLGLSPFALLIIGIIALAVIWMIMERGD